MRGVFDAFQVHASILLIHVLGAGSGLAVVEVMHGCMLRSIGLRVQIQVVEVSARRVFRWSSALGPGEVGAAQAEFLRILQAQVKVQAARARSYKGSVG